jgi:hypothetical protein
MNFFCLTLGHTWTPGADNPKTAWNTDESGITLKATPHGAPRFFEICARCKQTRPVATPPVGRKAGQRPS